ncbi:MAG: DUF2721 domain-containing protein [Candidatus Andeanibacterium colombiense]|uniref:DUF2721 domain-containing protein n=1 Tax=Candidatus Andeanibacterium colombiense TaxID=3121345 RepID=A0AAJ6BM03_9SPHN|nr:MAG: DUF2721 domain-containing protein [Sphingomonadaceae bacterium]
MISHTIQLALAPVFVLVAIGNILNILAQRLSRVVDRSRLLQQRHAETSGSAHDLVVIELRLIARRIVLISRAILLLVVSGLTIGMTVVVLFLEEFMKLDLQQVAAAGFIVAIALLMTALWHFLLETRTATAALRIPEEYLETHREL